MMTRHTFTLALALWIAVFAGFKFGMTPPIPASVLMIYMVLISVAILVFVAADEARFAHFLAPLKAVFEGRAPKAVQIAVLAGIPLLAGWGAWLRTAPSWDAPYEPRVVHPEPPSQFVFKGQRIDQTKLKNPLRAGDPATLAGHVEAGKTLYYKNCFYCHGDALAGDGHFAPALRPIPANFRDVGTLSMLQESYVFWRIATGGPGLPKGATPWNSAMPAWQNFLTEEEIWQVILFIYEGSGSTPRTWEEAEKGGHK
ncbi:MAG: cytochrome c [Pseudomonadota bacterium]|nr:cytochrome c [Pseudomonadota bacterium]MDP2352605.1 cytochrome c [Pseudomonadota bacterium]